MRLTTGLWLNYARSYARSERGSIAILSAGALGLISCFGVIAADLGTVYLERREAQGAVDLAAVSAIQDLNQAELIVRTVLADNGIDKFSALQVTTGRYSADATLAPADRFQAAAMPANAVKVELLKTSPVYFGGPFVEGDGVEIGVEAVATATDLAAFSIGSRLLSINGGVVNSILSSTLGTTISLSAVDYRALAQADVDLFQTFDALATEADLEAVTYQDVLDGDVSYPQLVDSMAAALDVSTDPAAVSALNKLAQNTQSVTTTFNLGDLIDLGPYAGFAVNGGPAGFDADLPLLSTASGAAMLANGENQVAVDLTASLAGLVSAQLDLAVGEREQSSGWLSVGPEGTVVQTAQVRLGLRLTIGGSGLLEDMKISLPLVVEVAQAEAALAGISCQGLTPERVEIAARPGIANAWIGELEPYELRNLSAGSVQPAELAKGRFVSITGSSHVEAADMEPETVVFTADDIREKRVHTVSTSDAAQSLTSALVDDLRLGVSAFGLSLTSRLPDALSAQLRTLAEPIDEVLASVFELSGVGLGEADLTVHGVRCGGPGLVG